MDNSSKPSIITKFSLFFVNNWRVSILMMLGLLIVGFASYTTFLKREGFPAIEVPVVLVQTPYFVDDQELVDQEITQPIEQAITNIEEVRAVRSTTTDVFSNIVVEFQEGTPDKEGIQLIRDELQATVILPDDVTPQYRTINAAAFDGENDLVFSLIGENKTTNELTEQAEMLASEIQKLSTVIRANVTDLTEERTNPITGETTTETIGFGRSGFRDEDNNLVFKDAILIGAVRQTSVGTIEFSESVQNAVTEMEERGDLDGFEVIFGGGDLSRSLTQQISGLESNAITGLLAVMIILMLFVNWRSSIVMAFFIPTVMATTFGALFLLGYSLNTLSLFALILVIGIVADDAIVVIDAIDYSRKQGYKGREAIIHAINNVGIADISGSVTTILVFAPLAAVSGVLGEFIRLIPITVITALSISLIIGLSVVPFLGNIILPDYHTKQQSKWSRVLESIVYFFPRLLDSIGQQAYRFVHAYVQRWWASGLVLIATIGLIAGGLSVANQLEFSIFAPAKDTDAITISVEQEDEETTIQDARNTTIQSERIIRNIAGDYIDDITYFNANTSGAFLYVTLTPIGDRETTSTTIVTNLNQAFDELITDAEVSAEKAGAGPPSDDFQVTLQIFDDSTETLQNVTQVIKEEIGTITLNEGEVTEIAISNVDTIAKRDGRRFAAVQFAVSNPTSTALILDLQETLTEKFDTDEFRDEYDLSRDAIGFDLGQEGENLDSFQSALFALIIAIVVMYALLVLQFNSFTQPLLILTAVPLAFPGLFPGLLITDNPLSFFVMVGIIGLIGIVVNNTILLLDFANSMRAEKGIAEAISEAVKARFRPLFTTSATTLVGILPLALSDPFWEPLAFSIIFGLLSSTTLVLLAFPVFYVILEHIRRFTWRTIFRHKDFK